MNILRSASLGSNFSGSYRKSVNRVTITSVTTTSALSNSRILK